MRERENNENRRDKEYYDVNDERAVKKLEKYISKIEKKHIIQISRI